MTGFFSFKRPIRLIMIKNDKRKPKTSGSKRENKYKYENHPFLRNRETVLLVKILPVRLIVVTLISSLDNLCSLKNRC